MAPDLTEGERNLLRTDLPEELDHLEHALRIARDSLDGPDPEAVLGHLAVLGLDVFALLGEHRTAALAAGVPAAVLGAAPAKGAAAPARHGHGG